MEWNVGGKLTYIREEFWFFNNAKKKKTFKVIRFLISPFNRDNTDYDARGLGLILYDLKNYED